MTAGNPACCGQATSARAHQQRSDEDLKTRAFGLGISCQLILPEPMLVFAVAAYSLEELGPQSEKSKPSREGNTSKKQPVYKCLVNQSSRQPSKGLADAILKRLGVNRARENPQLYCSWQVCQIDAAGWP